MFFRQVIHEDRSCLSYLIGCASKGTVAVIDPRRQSVSEYLETARRHGLSIDCVIDTHTHADHESGSHELVRQTGAAYLMHERSPVAGVTRRLADGETFQVGNRRFAVIATPGHTADGVALHVDDWYLLTGDTLFVGDVGRVDLVLEQPTDATLRESAGQLHQSVRKLAALPEWTEIYPGHFAGSSCGKGMSAKPISTIGRERRQNEALGMDRDRFVEYVTTGTPDPPADYRSIKRRNIGEATHV